MLFSPEFVITLESPSPLLGRDILSKLQASVFMNTEPALSFPLIEQNVNPKLWTDEKNGGLSTKCCSCHYQAQRPSPVSTSKAVPTKARG